MNSFGIQQGTIIRQPATANFMIDSADRGKSSASPWDFQITRNQSLMNGYFSRIGTTEVILEWCVPNISSNNNTLIFDISGATGQALQQTITLTTGFYTVEQMLKAVVAKLTDLSGTTGSSFSILQDTTNNQVAIAISAGVFRIDAATTLSNQIGFPVGNAAKTLVVPPCADLRITRYIDFISAQLTYCQDLKDTSTAPNSQDVLCRWYMANDTDVVPIDAYGFPIRMGYTPFSLRRLFSPPKQIRWDNYQPLGNLAFQVLEDQAQVLEPNLSPPYRSNWLMTCQMSEN